MICVTRFSCYSNNVGVHEIIDVGTTAELTNQTCIHIFRFHTTCLNASVDNTKIATLMLWTCCDLFVEKYDTKRWHHIYYTDVPSMSIPFADSCGITANIMNGSFSFRICLHLKWCHLDKLVCTFRNGCIQHIIQIT